MTYNRRHVLRLAGATAAAVGLGSLRTTPALADSSGLSALVSADLTNDRLRLVLNNQSTAEQTFSVNSSGTTLTRKVAAGENSLLTWTREAGSPYDITVSTSGGFDRTESGTMTRGLGPGTPRMNSEVLFSTSTRFRGLKNADGGSYTGTVKSVRIPALAVTNDGSILAVADARVDSAGDLGMGSNDIQIALRRSTDSGATWSDAEIIAAPGKADQGFGDASLLIDRRSGKIFCFFTHSPAAGISFTSSQAGSNAADDKTSLHVKYVSSTDDGATWSDPVELNPRVKNKDWAGLFTSSGHGIQLSGGRLLQPIAYRDTDGTSYATNIYSDDGGASWQAGGSAGSRVNESKAIERSTGAVEQNIRHNTVTSRHYATSSDRSTNFGQLSESTLIDPGVNADELAYLRPKDRTGGTPDKTATALFSNPASTSARDDLTIRLSTDDGSTWTAGALLKPGAAGYSTMAVLDDGTIANLYEVGETGSIEFSRCTLDWIKGA